VYQRREYFVDSLGWNEFAIVGHSMGGKAALLTTTLATKRVTRLCGITPVWAAPAPFDAETLKSSEQPRNR
jgi:pimeloyl-ACP methyl ester carboxylesterase